MATQFDNDGIKTNISRQHVWKAINTNGHKAVDVSMLWSVNAGKWCLFCTAGWNTIPFIRLSANTFG